MADDFLRHTPHEKPPETGPAVRSGDYQMARMRKKYPKLFLQIFFSDREALDRYLDITAGRTDPLVVFFTLNK
jgi:hypothetical protein